MKLSLAMKELEAIVQRLENEDLDVDESIELFEKGTQLAEQCSQELKEKRGKLTVLKSKNQDE